MIVLLNLGWHIHGHGQDIDEVTLTFAYPAVGQVYVNSVFRDNQPLVAAGELLSILYIQFDRTENRLGLKGTYPNKSVYWEIDPVKLKLIHGTEKMELDANKFFIGETDLYLAPEYFQKLFGIELTVNIYGLMLSLKSEYTLPIEERLKRQKIRSDLKAQAPENVLKQFPMLYPRNRSVLALGMIDYNLGYSGTTEGSQINYGIRAGIELLGGDLQGGVAGFRSETSASNTFNDLRWRYVFKGGMDAVNNPIISDVVLGQMNMSGPSGGRIRGVGISNTPVLPRRVLDVFAIEGYTVPDSEVELLIGDQLVDFVRADDIGYYRFNTPLTYGTIRIGIRIYTPQGEVITEDRQLQIPFNFVPRGLLNYNIQAGYRDNFGSESLGTNLMGNGDLAYGITNNLTVRMGVTQSDTFDFFNPVLFTGFSTRLFDQYLFNVDYLPNRFTRATGGVFYANNTSINVVYSEYFEKTINNPEGQIRDVNASYFFPFTIRNQTAGIRAGLDRLWFSDGEELRYQVDVNTRIGPIITRLNYREEIRERSDLNIDPQRQITASFTYAIPRTPGIPVLVRGVFFRAQLRHDMKRLDANALGSFQFSKTVFKTGRLTISYDRDIKNKSNFIQIGLLMDFQAVRSSTQTAIRHKGNTLQPSFNQTLSGSIGADLKNGTVIPTNRDQVGRAGASVRMFVDDNANGIFDVGEEIVAAKFVRLDQSASMLLGSDGILRLTQLQSYWTYRMTIDEAGLPDATLAPLQYKFSFVADPNRYKTMDIPLYRTGTIEGMVYLQQLTNELTPQPGIRMRLVKDGNEEKEKLVRSFSDGSFYAYGLIPGDYTMLVDTVQLAFMGVEQVPDTLKFTILPMPDGHWIDTLEIKLRPARPDTLPEEEPKTLLALENKLGRKLKGAVMAFTEAQELFYRGRLKDALVMVDSSLKSFSSDYALALKGSVTYLMGNKRGALDLWAQARAQNPFIDIPDTSIIIVQQDSLWSVEDVNIQLASIDSTGTLDVVRSSYPELMLALEAELGGNLNAAIAAFTEAQELFYRRRFEEAEEAIDQSLSIYATDHGLALKGSIAYLKGRRLEAWQLWEEARVRNPLIELPKTELLDRMINPVAETSLRNGQK